MSASSDNSTLPAPAAPRWTAAKRLRAAVAIIGEPAWVMFCMFGLSTTVLVVTFRFSPVLWEASESTVGQLVSNGAIYALAVMFVLLPLLIRKKGGEIRKLLGLDKNPALRGLAWALTAFAVYFWVTIVVSLLVSFIPGFNSEQEQNVGFNDVTTVSEYIMAFVGLVILPPIFEEVLFRGYLFGRLRRYIGFWFSTIVTSIAFGLVHGQWNVGVDTFVLSIFLCFLREYTGSLWAPMLLHALKNGLAYFFLFIAPLWGLNLIQ
jgi:hypothetical protein